MVSFLNIPDNWLPWIVLALMLLLFLLVGQKAGADTVELKADAGYKRPMLALEMNAGAAPRMFRSWDESTKSKLRTALWWDFLFIFIYPSAIATSCFIAGRFLDSRGIVAFRYTLIIIFLQLVAALFDATENFALLRVLRGPIESPWPQLARWCALCKFGLIIIGIVYSLILGGGAWLISLFTRAR